MGETSEQVAAHGPRAAPAPPALPLLLAALLVCLPLSAPAQERDAGGQQERRDPQAGPDEAEPPQFDEQVVVVGSRARPRSATESTVPIDAIPAADFAHQGDTNLGDQLRTILPSFHVNPQEDGDAATVVRPASLRGMAPDHTLVLVNGKRRHRGAVITWLGNGVADGAQGPDISAIPAIALRQVEVLRDGASAQYGSDAIAGVLNFQLKDDRSGGSFELRTGGQLAGGTLWDVSVTAGANTADFFFRNTVNASLGPETPDTFDPGLYRQQELGFNLDVSHAVNDRLNVAAGAEWRNEQFEIGLGQPESWRRGPYAAQGFSVGSNGFPGFSPVAAGVWDRANAAVYGDVEVRGAERDWTVGGAARFEQFADFGATLNGKLAGRWPLAGGAALRASASTGFRAPTPGQQHAFNVSTQFDFSRMDLFDNGTIPSTSRVAALRGGRPLDAETSINYSAGVVVERGPFTLTADYFRIALANRLTLTRLFALDPGEVAALVAEGLTSARNLANFRFFTNDLETRTQGLDLIATWTPPALGGGTALSFLFNRTATRATDYNRALLDPDQIADRIQLLEEALPGTRWIAAVRQTAGRWRLLGRLSWYGAWVDARDARRYGGRALVDLEAAWPLRDALTLTVGGRNVLNTYPQENPNAGILGNRYPASTPFGFGGGFYYVRLNYQWRSES